MDLLVVPVEAHAKVNSSARLGIENFCGLRMSKDHIRVALQGVKIMFRETFAFFGSDEQLPGLFHQRVGIGSRERVFLGINGLIHRHDEQ